jgi:hypothetical protein
MSYLAGKIVLAVTAGAPNNGRGEATTGRVKKATVRGQPYPYVSAQAFRRWLRDTMTGLGAEPSPATRVGKADGKAQKVTTEADPARYADDDLFGYMKATAKAGNGATTLRDSPFMVGTFLAVEPARPTEDFGVMSRGIGAVGASRTISMRRARSWSRTPRRPARPWSGSAASQRSSCRCPRAGTVPRSCWRPWLIWPAGRKMRCTTETGPPPWSRWSRWPEE